MQDALLEEEGAQPEQGFGSSANAVSLRVPAAQARQEERQLSAQEAHEVECWWLSCVCSLHFRAVGMHCILRKPNQNGHCYSNAGRHLWSASEECCGPAEWKWWSAGFPPWCRPGSHSRVGGGVCVRAGGGC